MGTPPISFTADGLAFAPGIPGHRLADAEQPYPSSPEYLKMTCSCGLEFQFRTVATGYPQASAYRTWNDHIESETAGDDEMIVVGRIIKERVTWELKVISRKHQHAADYCDGHRWYSEWGDNSSWYARCGFGLVVDKTSKRGKKSRSILSLHTSRRHAVRKGQEYLEKQSEKFTVEYEGGDRATTIVPTVVPTFRNTFSELITRTEDAAAGDIHDLQETIVELDEVLSLVKVLEARRQELAQTLEDRTVGLLTLGAPASS